MDATDTSTLSVEVAFALPQQQAVVSLSVPPGTTARDAVRQACLERHFPDLPHTTFLQADLGIFGKMLRDPERHVLHAGDRVEVYRPLLIDPKQARRQRAARGDEHR
ncbi:MULTISPECIES: RnfH family protein [unclassified Modicisalibacter]|uniref:RnfH family protein n=1 Tax=unclassified Modicisalibacter TaxID=2679913 RepID=UPI001CCC9794|nr:MULTISPECIES: RnfH family protein [unclassified Modicisalibacter]MBZ9558887.1 RnfH family protein [Modicisalibacter sp. R2A 31.J]MBZ9575221.1 RnfH family protein [Modicisalibacter sp. MOD 31.J]